jgi:hypothetical protein
MLTNTPFHRAGYVAERRAVGAKIVAGNELMYKANRMPAT